MPIKVACPNPDCKAEYQVAQDRLGKSAKCSQCGLKFTLQMSAEETAAPEGKAPAFVSVARHSPKKSLPKAAPLDSPPPKPAAGVELPAKIGPYQIKRLLGAGAMGQVYLAHDPHLDRDVALKVLPRELTADEERVSRFLREARLAAKVQHANTVVIYQVMVEEGLASIVMEMIEGGSLEEIVKRCGPMPWREATQAIRDAAAGLGAAHEMGLVHRDIKPANLMRTCKGTVKVVDFGLVRAMQSTSQLTQMGTILGTPAYMAPEQWMGQEADARSDLYSLVCTYYYLLTGKEPFVADSIPALGYQHRYEPFPDARKLVSDLPPAACRILARGTEKDPAQRFQTAAGLVAVLEAVLAVSPEQLTYDGLCDAEEVEEIVDPEVIFDAPAGATAAEEQPAKKPEPALRPPPNLDEIVDEILDEVGTVAPAAGATVPEDRQTNKTQPEKVVPEIGQGGNTTDAAMHDDRLAQLAVVAGLKPGGNASEAGIPPQAPEWPAVGTSLWRGFAAALLALDAVFDRLVGGENRILDYFLWATLPWLLFGAVWAGVWALTPLPKPRLQAIGPMIVQAGKPITITVSVENPEAWKGKFQYSLAPDAPPGTSINPQSGEFSWTPPPDQAGGKQPVTVSAQGPNGEIGQTTFVVNVIVPLKETALNLGNGVKLEMVLIPAGEFLMGSPDSGADSDEKPQHRVRITKPFYFGKYLVTQEQWQAVMESNPSHFKGPKNPVECVSWDDCQEFLEKLNAKIGVQGGKFALPTEAQWEYACRAGSTTRYCFGDGESALGEYAWYNGNSGNTTHPVGEKKPNAWGLYDMQGNVWEWCADWCGAYGTEAVADPTGPVGGSFRVVRGGGWGGPAGDCRSAYRDWIRPGYRALGLGLRVSRVSAE